MKQYLYTYRKFQQVVSEEQKEKFGKQLSGDFEEIPSVPTPPESIVPYDIEDSVLAFKKLKENSNPDKLYKGGRIKDKTQ